MKKIFIVALVLFACVFLLYKRSTQLIQNNMAADTLFVFMQDGCPHCHEALDYVNGPLKTSHPDLKVEILNIAENKNMAKLYVIAKQQNWNLKHLGTPVLALNGKAVMGWSNRHEKWLLDTIQKLSAKKSLTSEKK